jgi:plasmid stabilization system protein ParE
VSLRVILRPETEDDIREAFHQLQQARAGFGWTFIRRLRETLERIEAKPELNGIIWQDVRAARLKQFRYVVYYVVFDDRVEVLGVIHGSRDAGAWQSRA